MFYQIITHTPLWVWGLFALLLWLGLRQALPGSMGLRRITIMPIAMMGLSLYGTVSAFGATPAVLLAWFAAAAALATLVLRQPLPANTRYDSGTRMFQVQGSWVPLALMVGIFATKYFVGVASAMHLELTHDTAFAPGFSALSGAFSGVFAARAARLWQLALRQASGGYSAPCALASKD